MPNYNKVILMGNLTRDPEVKYTSGGTAIAKLGMAINRTWTNKEGQKQEETTFVDVDAFGRQAEVIGQYLKKGRPVMIEGRLKLDQWDDKQTGQKRSKLGVTLEGFQFLDSRGEGGGGQGYQSDAPAAGASSASASAPAANIPEDDDVPF
jgi:single-strand DNA-binding protein